MEKLEKNKNLFIILLCIILFVTNLFTLNKLRNVDSKFDQYNGAIAAINDSMKVTIKNGMAVYSKKAPEIALDDLTNSEYFKTLSKSQQDFYLELKKVKGIISATQVELQKQGQILSSISVTSAGGVIRGDSIQFKRGTELKFVESDTAKKLQWKASLALNDSLRFKFDYDYRLKIMTTFERQRDKSIVVNYKLDDVDMKINKMQNFIIPKEEKRTKLGRWIDKNKGPLSIAAGAAIFGAGGYVGYKLGK